MDSIPTTSSAFHLKESSAISLSSAIVNRRLTMTSRKTSPDAQACESETALCCPPEEHAVAPLHSSG